MKVYATVTAEPDYFDEALNEAIEHGAKVEGNLVTYVDEEGDIMFAILVSKKT